MKEVVYKRIAVVKLSAMGDIIHAMVALQFIKKRFPDLIIDWFVEKSFSEILNNNADINNVYELNLKSLKKDKFKIFEQIKLIRNYSKNNYDLVIDAQGLLKSAIVSKLLGKNIAGFGRNSIREKAAAFFYNIKVDIAYDENTIDRNCKILSTPLGFDINSDEIINKEAFLFYDNDNNIVDNYLSVNKKNIIFVVGSTWESRNYPKERFAELANALKENIIIVWGNEDEKSKAEFISSHSTYANISVKLSLNNLKYLISKSDLLIGNDTGPTHIAWGLNIPSITIFGPTPINRVYQTNINKVIKSNSIVNPFKLNKNDFSINSIEVDDILKLAKSLL
jgi:heptosyltransferase I